MSQPDNCRNCGAPYSGEERCEHCNSHLGIKNFVPLPKVYKIVKREVLKEHKRNCLQIYRTPIVLSKTFALTEMLKKL